MDYQPRITFEVDAELKRKVDNLVQWGQLKGLLEALVSDLVELLEPLSHRDREVTKALIVSRRLAAKDVIPSLNLKEE